MFLDVDPFAAGLAILGIVLGGILKGATGAGAPVIGVPMLALAFDVPTAVVIFTVPNLLSNVWQSWQYRAHGMPIRFTGRFALASLIGAIFGTLMLVALSPRVLMAAVAVAVFLYIGFRILRPGWRLNQEAGMRLAAPVGFAAGSLQGAVGISAPVSVSFLNAMALDREVFIATVSAVFVAMSLAQIPMLIGFGLMTWGHFTVGLATLGLIFLVMPVGAALGRRLPKVVFDRVILVLLAAISIRLLTLAI